MEKENERIQYLLKAWTSRSITPAEERELAAWIGENDGQSALHAYIKELVDQYKPAELLPAVDWEIVFERIQAIKQQRIEPLPQPPLRQMRPWLRWAAAAVIVFAIATIAIVLYSDRQRKKSGADLSYHPSDVSAPASNKAMITLADGRTVALDSLGTGTLARQGNVKVVKLADGQIAYQSTDGGALTIAYNTLSNPRGSKVINITLSDGSHVWLNTGSSITYPVAFAGNERKVNISGEAYFEVAHNASKPFYVTKEGMEVKVLGTHFNVNAYDDESDIKVTLLEGSVKVFPRGGSKREDKSAVTLRPGQQGVLPMNTTAVVKIKVVNNTDLDAVMAWKNGLFQFDHTPMEAVLKQLGRWYDIEVVYENGPPDLKLWGEMKRDLTLSQALRGLGKIGVNFKIDGKKLIVMGK